MITPELPLEHFTLQLQYAQRAVELSGMPLGQALMEYTQYWRRIGNEGWSFEPKTGLWLELMLRIDNGDAPDKAAYELYRRAGDAVESYKEKTRVGCFRYDFHNDFEQEKDVIDIHFKNKDTSGFGPLSADRQELRLQELKIMFQNILSDYPQAQSVHCGSWICNLASFQRLFPRSFFSDIAVEDVPFPRSSGIWGQFLNSEGQVKGDMAQGFLGRVKRARNLEELLQCFEFKILFAYGKIEDFYKFYGIK